MPQYFLWRSDEEYEELPEYPDVNGLYTFINEKWYRAYKLTPLTREEAIALIKEEDDGAVDLRLV